MKIHKKSEKRKLRDKLNIVACKCHCFVETIGNFIVDHIKINGTFFEGAKKIRYIFSFSIYLTTLGQKEWKISVEIKLRQRPQIKEGKFNEKKFQNELCAIKYPYGSRTPCTLANTYTLPRIPKRIVNLET